MSFFVVVRDKKTKGQVLAAAPITGQGPDALDQTLDGLFDDQSLKLDIKTAEYGIVKASNEQEASLAKPKKWSPMTLDNERYEVIRIDDPEQTVIGHVEASWGGDAWEFAKKQFGPDVIAYVENPDKPTKVGQPLWGGRAKGLKKNESTGAASGMGFQAPLEGEEKVREAIRAALKEVIRKKPGGGGYTLYSPNKGKKKPSKPVGDFPTRTAARRAELARFPPQDAEKLKKLRKDINSLMKDPKKRIEREKQDATGRKPGKKSGAPKRARKPKKESLQISLQGIIKEALFAEEENQVSDWDDRLSGMSRSAVAADKRLQSLQKGIEKKSISTLEAAVKQLGRSVRSLKAKVTSDGPKKDEQRQKTYVSITVSLSGVDVGPIYVFVENGAAKVEISGEARNALTKLDPKVSKQLRAELVSFQEDVLSEMDDISGAIEARDSYLSKVESGVDELVSGMDALELSMLKSLLTTKYRGGRAK